MYEFVLYKFGACSFTSYADKRRLMEAGLLVKDDEHLRELGIDSQERRDLKTLMDYEALFAEYERERLPRQKESLARIRDWVKAGERVALTCFEMLPHQCHRHCVANALAHGAGIEFVPLHL